MSLEHDKLRQSLTRLDAVGIGGTDPDEFPTAGIAPPTQHRAANRARLGIHAMSIKSPGEEHRGLVIEHEPHDPDGKIHGLRNHGPILAAC